MFFAKWFQRNKKRRQNSPLQPSLPQNLPIFPELERNERFIKDALGYPPDLVSRKMQIGSNAKQAMLIGMNGLVDKDNVQLSVIRPLLEHDQTQLESLADIENIIQIGNFKRSSDMAEVIKDLLNGHTLLLLEKHTEAIIISLQGFASRPIAEPKSEPSVRGPHEGFTEALMTNLSMLRRRSPDPKLRFEMLNIGTKTHTRVCIIYMEDIAASEVVAEVRKRISGIKTESIFESGYIEQYIDDEPQSLLPTIGNTEKPDKLLGKIMEGRIGILVDGSPTALWVPYLFMEGFQSPEDYYSLPFYSSFVRMLRFGSFWLAISLPAIYVATQNFHKEIIPTPLLASIAAARDGVPFPLVMELIIMILMFEILKEAGVRMPRAIGQAVSIVGALILGDAAVQAGIVGTPTIIVVALAGISTFIVTPFTDAVSLLRILLIIPASILGLFGLIMGILAMLTHIASLQSFGVPYFSPVAPIHFRDWKDLFIRVHLKNMNRAPESVPQKRKIRHQKP